MRHRFHASSRPGTTATRGTVLAVLLTVSIVAHVIVPHASATTFGNEDCAVAIRPSTIRAGHTSITVWATPSESIGALVRAEVESGSAIEVEVKSTDYDDGPFAIELDVNHARPGTWRLRLRGLNGDCAGNLDVEDVDARSSRTE